MANKKKTTSNKTAKIAAIGTTALVAVGAGSYGIGVATSDGLRDAPENYLVTQQEDYDKLESIITSLKIRRNETDIPNYNRNSLPDGWIDSDGNGCNTREDILINEARRYKKTDGCKMVSGTFYDYYTGKLIKYDKSKSAQGGGIHIDHMVSLGNAWISGGYKWQKSDGTIDEDKWKEFINYEPNLIPTSDETNIKKSDKDITEWRPTNESFLCPYIKVLVETKQKFELTVTSEEKKTFLDILKNNCITN